MSAGLRGEHREDARPTADIENHLVALEARGDHWYYACFAAIITRATAMSRRREAFILYTLYTLSHGGEAVILYTLYLVAQKGGIVEQRAAVAVGARLRSARARGGRRCRVWRQGPGQGQG